MSVIITESELTSFRRDHFAPEALLELVKSRVAVLLRIDVGVGKSWAADALLQHSELYRRFDLVIYAAPTWDVLNERAIIAGGAPSPVQHLIIEARPTARCGKLDPAWRALEARGCSTFAKRTLCSGCAHYADQRDPCTWPAQLRDIKGVQLVFTTEEQLRLNRSLVLLLMARTGARRPLVVLDEGRLFDACFDVDVTHDDLARFAAVLDDLVCAESIAASVAHAVREVASAMRRGPLAALPSEARGLSYSLNLHAFRIQQRGVERFGEAFRYVGYDVALLAWSQADERRHIADGVRFTARPYLNCHLLVLSAHLSAHYVGHRLGRSAIDSPYEQHRFLHTGTRIFNLRNRMGADSYFRSNHRSILDTFALAILRNIDTGRSTLLVSRKKWKAFCADYLSKRLAGWGCEASFIVDDSNALPNPPNPRNIPLIHYGVLGVNDYAEYKSVYCLTGYYVSSRTLNERVQEFDPAAFRVELQIVSGPQRRRRARVVSHCTGRRAMESLANDYLRRLEIDPVVQALGRARFATKPREVVAFQMADLRDELPGCRDVATPTELRNALGLPDSRDLDIQAHARHAKRRMQEGATAAQAAAELSISRATLFRDLRAAESLKTPTEDTSSCRRFETPSAVAPSTDGGGA